MNCLVNGPLPLFVCLGEILHRQALCIVFLPCSIRKNAGFCLAKQKKCVNLKSKKTELNKEERYEQRDWEKKKNSDLVSSF